MEKKTPSFATSLTENKTDSLLKDKIILAGKYLKQSGKLLLISLLLIAISSIIVLIGMEIDPHGIEFSAIIVVFSLPASTMSIIALFKIVKAGKTFMSIK